MSEHIRVRREGAVMLVGFDRPEKKNAIDQAMYEALIAAFDDYAANDALALVMHGSDDTYTAGNDLMGFMAAQMDESAGEPASLTLMRRIEEAEKPVIAAVEGWAVGIGATLLLHTDLVYMGRSAKLKMPFTELGIVPEAGASRLVTRRYGRQAAGELLLLSDPMSAERAYDLGLANAVVDDGTALDHARRAAERLTQMSATSVRMTKALMREADDLVPHMEEEMRQGRRARALGRDARAGRPDDGAGSSLALHGQPLPDGAEHASLPPSREGALLMVTRVTTFAFEGVEAKPVSVQCQVSGGNPNFFIVGLPDKSVSESRERIHAAFAAIGLGLPPKRITVNLAPADLRKEGSHFDLPIAVALMCEMGAMPADAADGYAVMGELGLGWSRRAHGGRPAGRRRGQRSRHGG